MTKTKQPLISLGARGSLANSITFVRRRQVDIAEKQPIPTYRHSLPQAYQRWLYQDYAYLWTQQTPATKAIYRALAAIRHTTPIAEWLRYSLSSLPDIAAGLHMDSIIASKAYDWSRNANHATIYGPILANGRISNSLWFDGINDYLRIPHSESLNITGQITIEMIVKPTATGTTQCLIHKGNATTENFVIDLRGTGSRYVSFFSRAGADVWGLIPSNQPVTFDAWNHVLARYDGTDYQVFVNAIPSNTIDQPFVGVNTEPVLIGTRVIGASLLKGSLDELRIYNISLPNILVARHAERRYP